MDVVAASMKWRLLLVAPLLATLIDLGDCQTQVHRGCPSPDLILPCRCLLREKEYQIWCSHSDLPRVLEGLKALGQHIFQPIDELILENNNLPSLPGKAFLPLKVMRLMLRYNSLERVSNGWLVGLEESLMELFIVEPDLRSVPEESLQNLRALEAVTIQTTLIKRLPLFSGLPKLRYLKVETQHLVELSNRLFRNMPSFEKVHLHGSARLERLEAGLFQDLPKLQLVNISFCGVTWMHLRAITRLPVLTELSLVGNKITDGGMVGRGARDLPALEVIRLDFNNIDRIREAAFVDLPSLKRLYLSNNRIAELQHGAFHRVPKLRTLDLSNNNVRRVHPESFLQHSSLEELYLMNNDINHIAELRSLLDALPRLTFLDMSRNSLEEIPFGALRGHSTLEELHLDYNKIHMIDREALMAMPALRELRLKNNSLTDRLAFPFWNLPALKGLDLSGNYFRRIDPRLLTNIPSLRKLDLSSNDIIVINPTSFLATPELEHVNISRNAIPSLHPATFRHLLSLYELDVSYNRLLEFVPGLPRGIENLHMKRNLIEGIPAPPSPDMDLPQLRMLDLSNNAIQKIPPESLRTMPQLKRLYMGRNALQQLEEMALAGLANLEILDLRNNRIAKLHPHALKETPELLELNLQENRLDVLIPELFRTNPNLKKLDISSNRLTEILSGTLEHTRNIEVIDASYNSLVNLPPGLYGMKKLRVLDLTDNRLKNIHPETLSSLVSLEELKMSRNFVQELRRGAFDNLPNLKLLHLDNNELVSVDTKAVHALPSLKHLKLSQNRLKEIPNAAFADLPSLQMAELQENELRLIGHSAFHKVPHLLMLNLSYNHISGLENAGLRGVRSLEMLDLSNNEIAVVASPSLEKLEWLVELRMDNNRICSVHGTTFNGMPRLRVLSLKNNKMATFPEHAVQKLRGNIAVLDIDGNPLACTCSLLWLRAWLQEQSVMGPRCQDGTLLREVRLSRQDCLQEDRLVEPSAPGCDAEILHLPNTVQQWSDLRRPNRTRPSINNNKINVAPSPEESDYFYDEYVDYPVNDTVFQQQTNHAVSTPRPGSSHYISGDTPVIYAATKNKTKDPDTPKGVVNSPSSSGFTFFGLPLPSINLNKLLGGRMDDKRKPPPPVPIETATAERKTAIVNSPPRFQLHGVRKPPKDLPGRPIIGMVPPGHPEIHSGFVPLIPGSGGFLPMAPKFNGTVERVNLTQATSSSSRFPTVTPASVHGLINKRGPLGEPSRLQPQPTQIVAVSSTTSVVRVSSSTTTTTTTTTEASEESDEDSEEIEDLTRVFATVATPTVKEVENFEDIFKEVVENVSVPPIATSSEAAATTTTTTTTTQVPQTEKIAPTVLAEPINSFTQEVRHFAPPDSKRESIGTPLSALLIPGGQQPQFRPSGRPSITKVQNPLVSASSPLQSDPEIETAGSNDDDIVPMAHNREAKNGLLETTLQPPTTDDDSMNWYFANYNKTNLEPYVSNGIYPGYSAARRNGDSAMHLLSVALCVVHYFRRQ